MTILEKWRMDHPDMQGFDVVGSQCPSLYYRIVDDIPNCDGYNTPCKECWNREFPEDTIEEKFTIATPIIKDSGDRTEFETGAVRDMREGKGRCDLMPLDVVSDMLGDKEHHCDFVLSDIANFMRAPADEKVGWLDAALTNFADIAYGGSVPTMFLEVAKHFEEGAKKYGENNWQKGIPVNCYIDSAVRHYLKWRRGDTDEPHDRAFVWNLMCCWWEIEYREGAH